MSEDIAAAPKSKREPRKKEKKPPKRIKESYLHNAGLAYLQRFAASSAHFRSIMMRKINRSCRHHKDQDPEACAALLDSLIVKFQDLGLLDDKAYMRGMVTSLRRRGLSSRAIQARLLQKGLGHADIQNALQHYDEQQEEDLGGDLQAALIYARRKKLGPFRGLKQEDRQKELAALARAGYSYDIAQSVLDWEEEEL